MKTEAEAKLCWCPFARVPHCLHNEPQDPVANRSMTGKANAPEVCCIASECMAWRWHTKAFFSVSWGSGSDGAYMDQPKARSFGSVDLGDRRTLTAYAPPGEKAIGFCGLAGKP